MTVTEIPAAAENVKAAPDVLKEGSGGSRIVHIQVARIREEDMRISEGTAEGFVGGRDRNRDRRIAATAGVAVRLLPPPAYPVLSCRPAVLPSSPLGNKGAIKSSFL